MTSQRRSVSEPGSERPHSTSGHSQRRLDSDSPIAVVRPGVIAYHDAWRLQRDVVARRQDGVGRDVVFLLEHPRVYTLGRRADRGNVLLDDAALAAKSIEVVEVDRGGDVTYHGPGQLVGYPVLRLASLRGVTDYVRALEDVLILTLDSYGVEGRRVEGLTGVWVGDEKIAAIGVRVASKGVTSHGFALNVASDLDDFSGIVPCGITDRGVCSLTSLGIEVSVDEAADRVEAAMAEVFAATLERTTLHALGLRPKASG